MASGFTVKVKMNSTNKIIKDHGLDRNGRVTRFLRDEADRLMNPFVPMDTGMGRRNKTYPNNYSIILEQVQNGTNLCCREEKTTL